MTYPRTYPSEAAEPTYGTMRGFLATVKQGDNSPVEVWAPECSFQCGTLPADARADKYPSRLSAHRSHNSQRNPYYHTIFCAPHKKDMQYAISAYTPEGVDIYSEDCKILGWRPETRAIALYERTVDQEINVYDLPVSDIVRIECAVDNPDATRFLFPAGRDCDYGNSFVAIHNIARDSWGDRAFLFAVDCGYSGLYTLAFGDCLGDAHEWFVDSAVNQLRIPEEDLADYGLSAEQRADETRDTDKDLDCGFTSDGILIDTDRIHFGGEVTILRAFCYDEETQADLSIGGREEDND